MKRIIKIITIIFMLSGCSYPSIPQLESISKYTEEQLENKLLGLTQDEIISHWKEPDGICFGLWCDVWSIDNKNIFVYYGEEGKIEKILIDEIQEPSINEEIPYTECLTGMIKDIQVTTNDNLIIYIEGYEDKSIILNDKTECLRYDAKTEETTSITSKDINIKDYVEVEIEGNYNQDECEIKIITVINNIEYLKDGTYMDVMENTITGIGRGTLQKSFEMEIEDSQTIVEIIEESDWIEDITKCESDYAFNLKGRLIYYHSECGTFNLYDLSDLSYLSSQNKEIDGISVKLDEENKVIVNKIINNYIK